MAYEYDQLGNVIGEYESEEERRRREAANQPVKQTITYNPDGTQEMTVKGTPEALSPVNPNTPTFTAPGGDTYNRMLQAESNNRNYLPDGRPVTSPKGAMFAGQVMPATAQQPGYGIRPAAAQTPEEYNRVGQEYYQAMLKKFGGNEQAAVAAYNAGPGRVQQNMQANAGQLNTQQLPRETQGYLQKVMGNVGNAVSGLIPSAQASTLPPKPVVPSAFQGQTNEFGGMESPRATTIPGLTPVNQMPLPPDPFQAYLAVQDNPKDLINLGYDKTMPENLQKRARQRAYDLMSQEQGLATAKEQVPTMSENDIARALREKTTGGSYVKAVLFGLLGMERSAMAEAAKLGIGTEQAMTLNGEPVMVKVAANGTPIEGYNAQTGQALKANELVQALGGGAGKSKPDVSMQDVEKDGQAGRVVTTYNAQNQPRTMVESGGKMFPYDTTWKPRAIATAAAKMDYGLITDLQKKHGGNVLDALKQFEETKGPQSPESRQEFLRLYGMGSTIPGGGAPAGAGGRAPAAPAPGAPQPSAGLSQPVGDMKTAQTGQREIVKKASDVIAGSDKIVSELLSVERAATDVLTKKNNFGTIISGMIPGEQTVGRVLKTQDYINTQNVLDVVNKQAAINAKMLGTNPTDRDLQFVTATKPDENWPPDAVAEWLRKSSDATRRTLDFARKQIETGGRYIPETPQPGAALGTAANPIKIR
jgi:soluble lytic murein transglycosylase